jgi:hypothetical protein
VGSPDYQRRAREECARFIELIRQHLGQEPEGARLAVKSNPHDFGTYYEVVCWYDEGSEEARKYAFRCESDAPARWDAKPPVARPDATLQCADCGLVPVNQDEAAHGFPCNRCQGENWKVMGGNGAAAPAPAPRSEVCDSCLSAAATMAATEDRATLEMLMRELGADVEDHLCDAVEAPGAVKSCACACRRG